MKGSGAAVDIGNNKTACAHGLVLPIGDQGVGFENFHINGAACLQDKQKNIFLHQEKYFLTNSGACEQLFI
jgi:hypothetical protein